MAIGLVMTILLFLLVGYYWATERDRQRSAQALFEFQVRERAAAHVAVACTLCHGMQGNGGIGPSLRLSNLGENDMIKVVSGGRGIMAGFAREKGGLFTAEEIQNIVTFIRSWDEELWTKGWDEAGRAKIATTPAVVEVPAPYKGKQNPFSWDSLAAQAAGKAIYEQADRCILCHGEKGDGKSVLGLSLNPPPVDFTNPARHKRLEEEPDHMLWREAKGIPGTAMPAWEDKLTEDEM